MSYNRVVDKLEAILWSHNRETYIRRGVFLVAFFMSHMVTQFLHDYVSPETVELANATNLVMSAIMGVLVAFEMARLDNMSHEIDTMRAWLDSTWCTLFDPVRQTIYYTMNPTDDSWNDASTRQKANIPLEMLIQAKATYTQMSRTVQQHRTPRSFKHIMDISLAFQVCIVSPFSTAQPHKTLTEWWWQPLVMSVGFFVLFTVYAFVLPDYEARMHRNASDPIAYKVRCMDYHAA